MHLARVAKRVDARDLKSLSRKGVPVRVWARASRNLQSLRPVNIRFPLKTLSITKPSARLPILMALAMAAATPLTAQRALPFSDDALVLGFGQIRSGIHGSWTYHDQLYSDGGKVESIGSSLSSAATGSAHFSSLSDNQSAIQGASGQSAFQLSLGTTSVNAAHRTGSTSLLLDAGLPGRLMLSVEIPFVRVENRISIRANDDANTANVGVNPAASNPSIFAADTALANQIARARTALNAQLSSCLGSTSSSCATVNARRTEAQNLVSSSATASAGILALASARYAPLIGSAAQNAITARVAALANAYRDFGINTISGSTTAAAPVPLTAAQYRDFLASDLGPGTALPGYKSLTRLGDINVGLKFRVADTERLRAAAFGRVYFPTGGTASTGEFFPLAAGEETTRTEAGGIADLFIGSKLSFTASAAGVVWLADDANARMKRSGVNIGVTPRYSPNRWLTLGAQLESRTLGEMSGTRIGGGLSFSNLSAVPDRSPRFPVEASFFHSQVVSGKGLQPKYFSDEFRVRIFTRK